MPAHVLSGVFAAILYNTLRARYEYAANNAEFEVARLRRRRHFMHGSALNLTCEIWLVFVLFTRSFTHRLQTTTTANAT